MDDTRRRAVVDAVKKHNGNLAKAAKAIGCPARTFWGYVVEYGIDYREFRPRKKKASA